ncbi:hypothetical protein [Methylobacterium sp. JK268]
MSSTAAVATQTVAVATIETPRGVSAAVAVEQLPVAIAAAEQGVAGPPGPAGAVSDLTFTAPSPLSGHRAVCCRPDGSLAYASADDAASVETYAGVTTGAAAAGAPIAVRSAGELVEPSWSWSVGAVYLGLAGALVQPEPVTGALLVIGIALSPTRLLLDPEPPIYRG